MSSMWGLILIVLGLAAIVRGFTLHGGERAMVAYGLGVAALALGAWHLTRRPVAPRR